VDILKGSPFNDIIIGTTFSLYLIDSLGNDTVIGRYNDDVVEFTNTNQKIIFYVQNGSLITGEYHKYLESIEIIKATGYDD
jgi:hypothetical protein